MPMDMLVWKSRCTKQAVKVVLASVATIQGHQFLSVYFADIKRTLKKKLLCNRYGDTVRRQLHVGCFVSSDVAAADVLHCQQDVSFDKTSSAQCTGLPPSSSTGTTGYQFCWQDLSDIDSGLDC